MKGRLGVFFESTPLACINLLKCTFGKTGRDLLQYIQRPMMQMAQLPVPGLANISALHPFFFCTQISTLLYLQLIEILHLNPYLLYLWKERLSFQEDHIIACILKHGNKYQVILQPKHIHKILQGEWSPMLPLKSNRAQSSNIILSVVTHLDTYLEIFLLQLTEKTLVTGHVERSFTIKKPTISHHG